LSSKFAITAALIFSIALSNNCLSVSGKVAAEEAGLVGDDAAPRPADEGGTNVAPRLAALFRREAEEDLLEKVFRQIRQLRVTAAVVCESSGERALPRCASGGGRDRYLTGGAADGGAFAGGADASRLSAIYES
jgi:hypothetical protein